MLNFEGKKKRLAWRTEHLRNQERLVQVALVAPEARRNISVTSFIEFIFWEIALPYRWRVQTQQLRDACIVTVQSNVNAAGCMAMASGINDSHRPAHAKFGNGKMVDQRMHTLAISAAGAGSRT